MTLHIPARLLPVDGRFGSGPSKIRDAQLADLSTRGRAILGTSHRKEPVKALVGSISEQLRELFSAPEGYEVVVGNGGSTVFWDVAAASLVDTRAQCLNFGVFGRRFAAATIAPWLQEPSVRSAPEGGLAEPELEAGVDVYAWPHNETSTGVVAPVRRVGDSGTALTVIDGTSAAGAVPLDLREADAYYFAPQKNLGSDGGLWIAFLSPAAAERAERLAGSDRFIPDSLNLQLAIENSRVRQTLNTPALATLLLLDTQLEWILNNGGMSWAAARARETSGIIYEWAEASQLARPFVSNPLHRSPVTATIEFDSRIDTGALARILRENGVVDVEPYRGVGTNQLRIATFVSVDPDDAHRLVACIDSLLPGLLDRRRRS